MTILFLQGVCFKWSQSRMAQGLFGVVCIYQPVRVTCELTASENNHREGLWQTMGRHKSQKMLINGSLFLISSLEGQEFSINLQCHISGCVRISCVANKETVFISKNLPREDHKKIINSKGQQFQRDNSLFSYVCYELLPQQD